MNKKIAIQMDDISNINFATDSTLALAMEAQSLGHEIYYYTPNDLILHGSNLQANIARVFFKNNPDNFYALETPNLLDLKNMDVILVRQDPPFDMRYITTTYFLEMVKNDCIILNNPTSIRDNPEKILVMNYPDITPKTIITEQANMIIDFVIKHQIAILKPLYSCGGVDIFKLSADDLGNAKTIIELMQKTYHTPLIIQEYISQISQGDKRIILFDGKPVGAVNRVPNENSNSANFHAGGGAQKTILSKRDLEICQCIAPYLQENGLFFVGIDIIGDYLTEINVTSPTGIQEIDRLDKVNLSKEFWELVNKKYFI